MLSVETGDAASLAQSPSRSLEIERQLAQGSVSLSSDTYANFFFVLWLFFFIMKHGSQNNVPSQNILGGSTQILQLTPPKFVRVIR